MEVKLQFSGEPETRLNDFMRKTNASSVHALLNSALTLYGWAIRQKEQGRTIASIDHADESYREISIADLETVAPLRRKVAGRA